MLDGCRFTFKHCVLQVMLEHFERFHAIAECGINDSDGATLNPAGDIEAYVELFRNRILYAAILVWDHTFLLIKRDAEQALTTVADTLDKNITFEVPQECLII